MKCLCGCGGETVNGNLYIRTHQAKNNALKRGNNGDISGTNNPNYGNKWTDEQKLASHNKMVGRYEGANNPFWGKHHTNEVIQKISIAHKGKSTWDKLDEATKSNIRNLLSTQRKGKNNPMYGMRGKDAPQFGKRGKQCSQYGKPPARSKRIYYISPLQDQVCFRSSWEAEYAKYLDSIHELWYYEIDTFELSNEMTYTPDFFLPKLDKFVEIKGRVWNKDGVKFQLFKEEYPFDLDVLYGKDLKELGLEVRC